MKVALETGLRAEPRSIRPKKSVNAPPTTVGGADPNTPTQEPTKHDGLHVLGDGDRDLEYGEAEESK